MRERGLRQADLLDIFGVETRGAVGHYLTGRREPNVHQLLKLAHALGITLSELVGDAPVSDDAELNREIFELLRDVGPENYPMLIAALRAAAAAGSQSRE